MAPDLNEPPRERVAKAIEESGGTEQGKVMKVLFFDEKGEPAGEWASTQVPEAVNTSNISGLQEPPYPLEQLVYLAEAHPVHSAALEQKTADITGKGWQWEADDPDAADETLRDDLDAWFEALAPDDMDMKEMVGAVWLDVETCGWGLLECTRDPQGIVQRVYHVPAHTVRAHRTGFKLVQKRSNQTTWFRRWGSVDIKGKRVDVDAKTGSVGRINDVANDLFVIKRPSRRSTWYGIPGYMSAVGWITLSLACRDDNLLYFSNRREPRWAIVLSNLQDDPTVQEDLRRAFTVDLKQPHRNIIIPIAGDGKIDFQQLSGKVPADGSFDKLSERSDKAIMVAHRVPAERLANAQVGPLGGDVSVAGNRVYKEGVVAPGQELLSARLNRFIEVEYALANGIETKSRFERWKKRRARKAAGSDEENSATWRLVMDDLDISSDREELDQTVIAFHGDLITLREARFRLKLGPLMKPVKPEPGPDIPVVDEAGQPVMDEFGLPVTQPGELQMPLDPMTGEPYPDNVDEVESEYNEMLYSELPGASGGAGNPSKMPPGVGNLSEPVGASRADRVALALLDADVRDLLTEGRSMHATLAELVEREEQAPVSGLADLT